MTARLFFVGPVEVISPGLVPGQFLNDIFQSGPEADHLQWVVQPSSSDAEVGLMGGHMVDAVMPPWQDDVQSL